MLIAPKGHRITLPPHVLALVQPHPTWAFTRRGYNAYLHTPSSNFNSSTASGVHSKFPIFINADYQLKQTDAEAEEHNRRLSAFRGILGKGNLSEIRDAYGFLPEHKSDAIRGRDLQTISWMLRDHYLQCSSTNDTLVGTLDMALDAASGGHTSGLKAYLLLLLKIGDSSNIISTYDRFRDLIQSRIVKNSDIATSVTIADLVFITITAHAIEDRFDEALECCLATPIVPRVLRNKVQGFCHSHLHDSSLSEKVGKWVEELVLLKLVSKESYLNNDIHHILDLDGDKKVSRLEKLYVSIISHLTHVNGMLVMDSTSLHGKGESTRRNITISSDIWASFLEAFFRCHRSDLAEKVWSDVVKLGMTPNHRMWCVLVEGYGRQRDCDKAVSTWNRMLEAGIEPNETCYGAMISAYFLSFQPDLAYALFQQFRTARMATEDGKKSFSSPRMLRLFNIVLHGLCMTSKDDLARNVLSDMTQQGPQPDIVTFNTFLRHYERIGDMKGLGGILRSLKPAGVEPDVHSFTTVLSALYKAGKPDAHTKILEIMKAMNVQPNVATYSAIIHFFVRQGGEDNLRKAREILARMEKEPNEECRPNEVTYTGILAAVHSDFSISTQKVKEYTADLLSRMRNQGKPPNRTTYHIIMKASLEDPQPLGLEMTLQYYREMVERNIKLFDATWHILLAGLLRRGDLAVAGEIIEDMFRSGHEPNSALKTLISKIQGGLASAT